MSTLYDTTSDQSQSIATMQELRAALPIVPANPSIWALDCTEKGVSVQIVYGDPDRHHATVKTFTAKGVERKQFETFNAATQCFLDLASNVLPAGALR